MSAPHTLEDMQQFAAHRGWRCVSATYQGYHKKLRWRCSNGHEWEMAPVVAARESSACPVCRTQERTGYWLAVMQELAARRAGRCLSTHYLNNDSKLRWQCANGHIWEAPPAHISLGMWCPACAADERRLTLEDVQALAARRGGRCLSGRYHGNTDRLRWQCAQGHEWVMSVAQVNTGHWCPACRKRKRCDAMLEKVRAAAARQGGECLSEHYEVVTRALSMCCSRGHVWSTRALNVLNGHWCPFCANLNRTKKRHKRLRYDFEG